ncbi:hypothetical protein NYE69_18605 [Paenibacillus sp. FSL R5-0527]|uniref:putative amidoligase domain-containing protein n=1 Tax=Paenibacillus sp. FSL R5-0527 TaxID=2975321 RepID=UPI002DBD385C|nr:hypothetical protein [Paenibacillus macerans]MEC0333232.1 hypothetical protein [Paenibacillus macerans]
MRTVNREKYTVLKIRVASEEAKTRLTQALERSGGRYRVIRPFGTERTERLRGKRKSRAERRGAWIHYGPEEAYWGGGVQEIVLNRSCVVTPQRPPEDASRRLRAAGISVSDALLPLSSGSGMELPPRRFIRRYAVSVFHLRALEARPLGRSGHALQFPANGPAPGSVLWKRLESTAVRALYALGLDMGEVVIAAGEEGRFTVEALSLAPEVPDLRQAGLFARAIREAMEELEQAGEAAQEPLIGMDPEFLLVNPATGKVIPASRYLSRHGAAGCDVLRYRGRRMFPLAELRPQPGHDPRETIVHLMRAFRAAGEAIDDRELVWQAGAMPQRGFPLGGHLHFSGVPLTSELLRTFDNYLALPLAVLEDGRSHRRRPRYGFLGDVRRKDYGGFEYRTLPSFLISPLVAKGTVALARLIAENAGQLNRRPLEKTAVFTAFYAGRQQELRSVLPPLIQDLRAAAAYPRYESYIAPLLEAVLSGRTWDESADIRPLWNLQIRS